MPRVLCTLPRASTLISGVRFVQVPNGMLSELITEDVAAQFASIPGYELVAPPSAVPETVETTTDAAPKRIGRPPNAAKAVGEKSAAPEGA